MPSDNIIRHGSVHAAVLETIERLSRLAVAGQPILSKHLKLFNKELLSSVDINNWPLFT